MTYAKLTNLTGSTDLYFEVIESLGKPVNTLSRLNSRLKPFNLSINSDGYFSYINEHDKEGNIKSSILITFTNRNHEKVHCNKHTGELVAY